MSQPVAQVVDLTDAALTNLRGISLEDARARVARGDAGAVARLEGSYALVGVDGIAVRLARSLDRPLRYFLAKEAAGPALVVADRIDAIARCSRSTARRTSSTRATRAWSRPTTSRAAPRRLPGSRRRPTCGRSRRERNALAGRPRRDRPRSTSRRSPTRSRPGSRRCRRKSRSASASPGGIDSGAVFLVTHHVLAEARDEPRPAQGVHAHARRRARPRAGPRVPRRPRPGPLPRAGRGRRRLARSVRGGPGDRGLQAARRRVRDHGARALRGIRARYPGVELPPRRRRRRREPQGLPDRGEPRADDPERREQPDALPGGLGRRHAQALGHVLGRAEPLVRRARTRRSGRSASRASARSRARASWPWPRGSRSRISRRAASSRSTP